MSRLQNPQSRIEAIKQDYKDKHNLSNSSVLVCRKYPSQTVNKNGQKVFNGDGTPKLNRIWYDAKNLTHSEHMYVHNSFYLSEEKKNDCYCTINSFPFDYSPIIKKDKKGKEKLTYRANELVSYLTGFYIDFDHMMIHSLAKSQQATPEMVVEALKYKEEIINTLEEHFESDYGMPVITFTGGGYGFYIKIKPMEANEKNIELYKMVWEKLYHKFNEMFSDLLSMFENDHSVVGDIVRVIRITGTYNSKTNTYSSYVARYGNEETNQIYEYDIEEIISLYHLDEISDILVENEEKVSHSPLQKKEEERRRKEKKSTSKKQSILEKINEENDFPNYVEYIKKDNVIYPTKWYQNYANIKQLSTYLRLSEQSLEYQNNQGTLSRNNTLFVIACLKTEIEYAKYGCYIFDEVEDSIKEDIITYIEELNDNLSLPLEEYELTYLLNSALQNKYHFRRRKTFQKFLELSDYEFDNIGWLNNEKDENKKKENNNALTQLDKEVIKLYLSGLSDEKIGKELNIPKLQSIRIRKRLGVLDRTIKFEDVDFEGNKRHLKNKTNSKSTTNQTVYERNIIPEEKIVQRFPIKYKDFFESPITSYPYFINHNYEYKKLGKPIKRELIRAYYRNMSTYMQKIGVRSVSEKDKQLLYLHNATNEKKNLVGNIEAIMNNADAATQLRSGNLSSLVVYGANDESIVTQVTTTDLYKPIYGEHIGRECV